MRGPQLSALARIVPIRRPPALGSVVDLVERGAELGYMDRPDGGDAGLDRRISVGEPLQPVLDSQGVDPIAEFLQMHCPDDRGTGDDRIVGETAGPALVVLDPGPPPRRSAGTLTPSGGAPAASTATTTVSSTSTRASSIVRTAKVTPVRPAGIVTGRAVIGA